MLPYKSPDLKDYSYLDIKEQLNSGDDKITANLEKVRMKARKMMENNPNSQRPFKIPSRSNHFSNTKIKLKTDRNFDSNQTLSKDALKKLEKDHVSPYE